MLLDYGPFLPLSPGVAADEGGISRDIPLRKNYVVGAFRAQVAQSWNSPEVKNNFLGCLSAIALLIGGDQWWRGSVFDFAA
jgi:hypothetical protein